MKRFLMTLTLAALTIVPSMAQGPGPRMEGGPGHPPSSTGRLDYLAGYLGLSDAQKQQATAIFAAAETASQTLSGSLTSAREALNTGVKANASDTELDRLSAAVGAIEGQLTAVRAKASAKFYGLLTAEQKAKYDTFSERRGPRP